MVIDAGGIPTLVSVLTVGAALRARAGVQQQHLDGLPRRSGELLEPGGGDGASAVGAGPAGAADARPRGAGARTVAIWRADLRSIGRSLEESAFHLIEVKQSELKALQHNKHAVIASFADYSYRKFSSVALL